VNLINPTTLEVKPYLCTIRSTLTKERPMSQSNKYPVLKIRNKNPGSISTGANTIVELDGRKLGNVSFIKIDIKARKVAKVTMELFAEVDIEVTDPDAWVDVKETSEPQFVLGNLSRKIISR
jgi:hypothetical protein